MALYNSTPDLIDHKMVAHCWALLLFWSQQNHGFTRKAQPYWLVGCGSLRLRSLYVLYGHGHGSITPGNGDIEMAPVTQVGRGSHAALDDIGTITGRREMELQFLRANRHH